jgi:uncharacterized protein (DUF1684 family)
MASASSRRPARAASPDERGVSARAGDDAYIRAIEEHRARVREELRSPTSSLAAIARHELPIGSRLTFGADDRADVRLAGMARDVTIAATEDGFTVDGVAMGPGAVPAGRYTLRLSHQSYPAVVVLDAESPRLRDDVERRWYPIDPAMRVRGRLEPDGSRAAIGSTASADRTVERVGWIRFAVDGEDARLLVTRLIEPGSDGMDIYFRDGTTGDGSYEIGRYVSVDRDGADVVVDFNRAYNPACALSPFYNCPIPLLENRISVPIRAGEMSPLAGAKRR